jgi:hypothetical protein
MPDYGSSVAGSLLMQGLSNAGNSLQEGMQNYQQNKQKDALLTGQIEPYLQQLAAQSDNLSPVSASALNKMMTGQATLKDKMLLYGDIASSQNAKNVQQAQTLSAQQIQANDLANRMAMAKYAAMQNYANPQGQSGQPAGQMQPAPAPQGVGQPMSQGAPQGAAQPQQGAAQPQPGTAQRASTTVNPPTPIGIDDPQIRAMYPQALAATGYDPDKASTLLQQKADAINAQNAANYQNLTKTIKDTGRLVYAGPNYTNGVHDFNKYYNEQIIGAGTASQSYTQGDKLIQYAAGSRPPVPVITAAGQQAPVGQDGTSDAMTQIDSVSPYNVNDPKWIADNTQAQTDKASSAQRVANSRLLVQAANTLASGTTSQWNALRQSPGFNTLQQLWDGSNPAARLKQAMAMNTGTVMNSLKSPSGGTTGNRVTAAEFEEADEQLGKIGDDLPSIQAAAQNINAINERAYNIDTAKADFRKIMPEDVATEKAVTLFGNPPALQAAGAQGKTSTQGAMATVTYKGQTVQIPVANLADAQARGAVLVQ